MGTHASPWSIPLHLDYWLDQSMFDYFKMDRQCDAVTLVLTIQELIRRCDSERELFYDDIVHVEASAYAH